MPHRENNYIGIYCLNWKPTRALKPGIKPTIPVLDPSGAEFILVWTVEDEVLILIDSVFL